MKAVCYCATRNLYPRLVPAVNSLLVNNKGIDRVYCILEDDSYVLFENPKIKVINGNYFKPYFKMDSPNAKSRFTYMAQMRLAFWDIFFTNDRILYLDVDTIVDRNIEDLWDIDLTDMAVAGVLEKDEANHRKDNDYINSGVLMMNLDYLRNGTGRQLLNEINGDTRYLYPDQDVLNKVCKGHKVFLPTEYNEMFVTNYSDNPKIVHYAGIPEWWLKGNFRNEYYQKYKVKKIT